VLSGIIGAALLGLGVTKRFGPRTGYPEISRQDLLKVVDEVKRDAKSFVRVKDPFDGSSRRVVVRWLGRKSTSQGSYRNNPITNIRYSRSPKGYPFNKERDELFHRAREGEAILIDPNLDTEAMISVLRHEIVHASDPSVVLQRRRESNNFHNYFYSREEVAARLAQIDFEITSHPDFIKMKAYCDGEIKKSLVDFDESSGELVYRDLIVYKNAFDEKCDPDDVPISKLISFSPTANETLTPFKKRLSKGSGEVPVPKPTMKAIGALLSRLQQEVRDSRRKRIKRQLLDKLRDRKKDDLGSPPAARFVRKRSYRT